MPSLDSTKLKLNFERFGIRDISEYDNILCVDLGHGETSAALWKPQAGFTKPQDLYFDTNQKEKIFTALFIDNKGGCNIGAQALDRIDGNLYVCFKAKPSSLIREEPFPDSRLSRKELVQKFFTEVIRTLYNCNTIVGKTVVLVGCPSSEEWFGQCNGKPGDIVYAEVLSGAIPSIPQIIGRVPVAIMPESRAAIIKVSRERVETLNLNNGVVVFDFGSSTLDCTYVNADRMLNDDFSEPLGAHYIEDKMLEVFLGGRSNAGNYDKQRARITMRSSKEAYYNNENTIGILHSVEFRDGSILSKKITSEFMRGVVNNSQISYATPERGRCKGSWASLCGQFLADAKRRLEGKPIGAVLLTGGASRMGFVKDIVERTFNNRGTTIYCDNNPSFCVSRGMAYAGCVDRQAAQANDKTIRRISEYLKSDECFDFSFKWDMGSKIADKLYSQVHQNVVESALTAWRDSNAETLTPNDMCRDMNVRFETFMKQEGSRAVITNAFSEMFSEKEKIIKSFINEEYKSVYDRIVPDDFQFSLTDCLLRMVGDMVAKLKYEFDSSATINKALGIWGWGQVLMDAPCNKEDRTAKANRALEIEDRKSDLESLCKEKLRSCAYCTDFTTVVDDIINAIKPQIDEMVNNTALHFNREA